MPLSTNVTTGDANHPGVHNAERTQINANEAAIQTKVGLSGSETVNGTKTFTSSPVVPTPTSSTHAATKAYVDANAGDGGVHDHNATYVALTGNQSVSGVKTFASSPIVPAPTTDLQAATKKYVDDNTGGTFPTTGSLTIVEISTGNWSGDAPVRTAGVHPIEFRGWSDPAGVNGITTPARINAGDVWTVVTAP
jgi:hypothetical protein